MPVKELRGLFPKANISAASITSAVDGNYNCVAWALKQKNKWWEPYGQILPRSFPTFHWPDDLPHDTLIETYVRFFRAHGYDVTEQDAVERGLEKIAIYTSDGHFRHVARQLPTGRWTSKLGDKEDIEHGLRDLESDAPFSYGCASVFMSRPIRAP